jgi:hypothetical protein
MLKPSLGDNLNTSIAADSVSSDDNSDADPAKRPHNGVTMCSYLGKHAAALC